MFLQKIFQSPSIRATFYFAASGACFVVATLILAKALPPAVFGIAALVIAVSNVGIAGAPSGLTGILLRHDIRIDRSLLRRSTQINLAAGFALGTFTVLTYGLGAAEFATIVIAVGVGGLALLGLVPFQKARRFGISVPLSLVANPALLLAAGLLLFFPAIRFPWLPTLIVAGTFGIVAAWAWSTSLSQATGGTTINRGYLGDWFHFSSFAVGAEVLWQLERLLIPVLLSIEDMATYAVVAALAVAPFHVLSSAAGATLIPRLQAEPDKAARRSVLARETWLLVGLSVLGGALLLLIGPTLIDWYLGPKVAVSTGLLAIAVLSGVARLLAALARTPAAAFCNSKELERVSIGAWLAVAVAVMAAWALAGYGLHGLIVGVTLGWLARGVVAIAVAWRYLN